MVVQTGSTLKQDGTLPELKLLLLIIVANGTPIIARNLLQARFATPLDAGYTWFDKRPLFGPSKTIRGILAAILMTTLASMLLGLGSYIGLLIACYAMIGDLLASFIKRRCNVEPSGMVPGLDQIPESLLPLLVIRETVGLSWTAITVLVILFIILELLLSRILYRLHIRKRPY